MNYIVCVHLLTTVFMTGLIWFVQVVHYPLFSGVGPSKFTEYAVSHQQLTAWVVIAPMLVEMATGALLALSPESPLEPVYAWSGLVLLGIIWASTFFLQVPEHALLSQGVDTAAINRLVRTNWIRTIAWSTRSALLLIWLSSMMHQGVRAS